MLNLKNNCDSDTLIQFNSIQFICIAHFHKLQICLRVLYNLFTFRITDQEKLPNGEKREETFRRATEEDPSPSISRAISEGQHFPVEECRFKVT